MSATRLPYLHQAQPKVHFSSKQNFVPREIAAELFRQSEMNPKPEADIIGYDNVIETINQHYTLPFQPYDYQALIVNALAQQNAVGLWAEVGTGKTLSGSLMALYHRIEHAGTIIVVMPPILLKQWQRWFQSIPELNTVLIYRGTPKQRAQMDLNVDVLLVSMDIFKNDFLRLYEFYYSRNVTLIVDEAVSVKNYATMNHKCVWAFHNQDLTQYQLSITRKTDKKTGEKLAQSRSKNDQALAAMLALKNKLKAQA